LIGQDISVWIESFRFEDEGKNKDKVLKFFVKCLRQIVTMSRLLKNFVVFTSRTTKFCANFFLSKTKFWASIFTGNSCSKCKNIKSPSTLNIFFVIGYKKSLKSNSLAKKTSHILTMWEILFGYFLSFSLN